MKKLSHTGIALLLAAFSSTVFAASHPLTAIVNQPGITYVDQVVSIDWDINNPPSIVINGVNTPLDKTYIQNVMNGATDLLYTMTEGKLRMGKVSVYSNSQYIDNADIQIFNKEGRANAHINGLNARGTRNEMFTSFSASSVYDPNALGQVIAHEFGHYMLGIFDEYREVGKLDISNIGGPQDRDTARDTIMRDQHTFSNMSTPADYADATQRQTAHYRVFNQSAWQTVVADPAVNDTYTTANNWPKRTWFESFKGMAVPTTLAKPVNPTLARGAMQITYMSGVRTVIVIDLGVPAASLAAFVQAAEATVRAIVNGGQVAVMTVSGGTIATPVALTTLGAGATDPERVRVRAAIAALAPSTATTTALDAATLQAAIIASPLAAARDAATKAGTALPLSNTVTITQTPIIMLFGSSEASLQTATTAALTNGGVMLNANLLSTGGAEGNMSAVAGAAHGMLSETKSPGALVEKAIHAMKLAEGELHQIINETGANSLAAGASLTMNVPIASAAVDGEVTITAEIAHNKATLTLTSPSGGQITVANAISFGITATVDTEEGDIYFVIPATLPNRIGNWVATVTATSATTEGIDMDATSKSAFSLEAFLTGGTTADPRPLIVTATLAQPLAVKNATVTAAIYDSSHVVVTNGINLKDDGVAPDVSAGDGIYTASLAGILTRGGEYEVEVSATNAGLKAAYGTGGSRIAGANKPDIAITEAFTRKDIVDYVIAGITTASNNTVTVTASSSSGSSGGGCTLGQNGPFDPLFPGLLAAAAALYISRRKKPA